MDKKSSDSFLLCIKKKLYCYVLENQSEAEKNEDKPKRVVHEGLIEDKGKNVIYLRLSASTVSMLDLKVSECQYIQFNLRKIYLKVLCSNYFAFCSVLISKLKFLSKAKFGIINLCKQNSILSSLYPTLCIPSLLKNNLKCI